MGCCSSTEADAETDILNAKWTEELPCPCSRQHSFTTGLTLEVVPVKPISCCPCSCTILTCGVPIGKEETHIAVQATFKCDSCGHQFRRTYEMLYLEKQKHKRWGYYGKRIDVWDHSTDRFSFAHLEECYALTKPYEMDPDGNWANEFYELVTEAGESNCAMEGWAVEQK